MNLLNLFRSNDQASCIANAREIVSRYKRLRSVGRELNNTLLAFLTKDVIHEAGRRLGMLKRGVLVFDSEAESAVLTDYCLYDIRRKGRNIVEQYLIDSPPEPDSDEFTCLRAMQQAFYCVLMVESVERGVGVTARDLLRDESHLVVDRGLAHTASPGTLLAVRLLPQEGFTMTSGAALPLGKLPPENQQAFAQELGERLTPNDAGHIDPAPFLREILGYGVSSAVRYQDAPGTQSQRRISSRGPSERISRNATCPCGSGKKFKQCCMRSSR